MDASLHIQPRYYRWHVDPGVDWIEKNTTYANLDWEIPLSQAALVLVDVWDHHYLRDPEERAEEIIQKNMLPLLEVCREKGLEIIHAPSPPQAKPHPAWVGRGKEEPPRQEVDWPPRAFRSKSDVYQQYARPQEVRQPEIDKMRDARELHKDVRPEGDEVVVATGEELHQYCKKKGILFLFFAGFNTNACILLRDYGTVEMSGRGYEIIIVRDCTTGMESFETHDELWQTRGAILFLEMFGKYSILSQELIAGLPE